MIGGIGLGAGKGASGDVVSRGPDNGALGARGLSTSAIASCVLGTGHGNYLQIYGVVGL
jgi:hypothetical protein